MSLRHLMWFYFVSFLHRIVTGHETWVHRMTPEMKQAWMSWKHPSSPLYKKFKAAPYANKVMAIICGTARVLLLVDFLIHRTTMITVSYCAAIDRLRKAVCRKWPGLLSTSVLLLYNNLLLLPKFSKPSWLVCWLHNLDAVFFYASFDMCVPMEQMLWQPLWLSGDVICTSSLLQFVSLWIRE